MAEPLQIYSSNLIVLMDALWFQQIILFSQPNITLLDINTKSTTTTSSYTATSETPPSSPSSSSSSSSSTTTTTSQSPTSSTPHLVEEDALQEEDDQVMKYRRTRPTRLNLVTAGKTRSQSSSPSVHKLPKHLKRIMGSSEGMNNMGSGLRKARSCRSLLELEYEEVKGFMDLGFTFNKDQLSPRMMSVIPGLQRLVDFDHCNKNGLLDDDHHNYYKLKEEQVIMEDQKRSTGTVTRPYLSEAWLIKRPDSPLLNLRIPRFSAPADMKKHLRFWARTVASAIQLEY